MKKSLKIFGLIVLLGCVTSCTTDELTLQQPVESKVLAYYYQDNPDNTENKTISGENLAFQIATFSELKVQNYEVIRYDVFYESPTTNGGEWLILSIPSNDFLITQQIFFDTSDSGIYGKHWKTSFKSKKKFEYETEFVNIRMLRIQVKYQINGIWYKTSIDSFYPNTTVDTFWV
jgi:hypothetical protein